MANFGEIKKLINALINTNGRQAITGKVMNATLVKMMDSVETAISEDVQSLNENLGSKVDKETGKGLSSNDYTDEDREKLASLENYDDSEVKETLSTLVKADTELAGAIGKKVDKVEGKQLTTEDFTTALKEKLQGLNNYDDAEVKSAIERLRGDFDTLVAGDTTAAIKSFNDIVAFLEGIEDSESLDSIIASIEQQIAGKQDVISDLNTIRQGAAKGSTALQSVPEYYVTEQELAKKESYPIEHVADGGNVNLIPNRYYIFEPTSNDIQISLQEPINGGIVNEYVIQITLMPDGGGSILLPVEILWEDGIIPVIDDTATYVISIVNNLAVCAKFPTI